MQCHGRSSRTENLAKPDRMDGGTKSNPHVRWCGMGDWRNPVTSTRFCFFDFFTAVLKIQWLHVTNRTSAAPLSLKGHFINPDARQYKEA